VTLNTTSPASPASPPRETLPPPTATGTNSLEDKTPQAPAAAAANSSIEMQQMEDKKRSPRSAFSNSTSRSLATAAGASVVRPHWRINEQGQPERAFGAGPWQPVLPNQNARMHVLSESGGEVWIGGENSQLFRSFDNGNSWRPVSLPEKDGSAHTIAHIRFESAREISIEAVDGTTWTSIDGGESWK
jgi:photosystem II stability/assembly factor-like uncharacterized protein